MHPFSHSIMLAAAALAATFTLTAPDALQARKSTVYYTAKLSAPATDARYIAGGRVWLCEAENCIAERSNARGLRVCREFVREVGPVIEFTIDGQAMDSDALAKCNG